MLILAQAQQDWVLREEGLLLLPLFKLTVKIAETWKPWLSQHEVSLDECLQQLDVADTYILIGHIPVGSLSK